MGDGGYTRNRTELVLLKGRVLSQKLGLPLKNGCLARLILFSFFKHTHIPLFLG